MVLLSTILFFACTKELNTDTGNLTLVGKWILVETLAGAGDGSGKWQPVDATKNYFIKFNTDNSMEQTYSGYVVLNNIRLLMNLL